MRLVWAVDHGLEAASKRMRSVLGVTAPQRLVIRIVGLFPGVSAGGIAAVLHLDPSTLSGVLKRLEERKFIRRKPDAQDRRRAVLHLTAKGRRINATTRGTVEEAMRLTLATFPAHQVAATGEVLRALAQALEAAPRGKPRAPVRALARR